jgi:hypothetical protein
MNKKEILEIKKLFTNDKCCIQRICGCYVDGNKNKVLTFKDAFLSLEEEEIFKYFKIFRQTLSGTVGKNLLNMEFPLEQEETDGTQDFLLKLRDSHLKDDDLLELFYNKIIDNYIYGENYLILLIDACYDVPAKGTDENSMEDASDYVYEHILCSICPVNLSKEGLCYNAETNTIENRTRDWLVEVPSHGFLFPAFNDRNTDIHSLLYYSKNTEEIQTELIDRVLGCVIPMTSKIQKNTFTEILEESLGEECTFEAVKTIHENLNAFVEEHKDEPEPVTFGKEEVRRALEKSGVANERIEDFEHHYSNVAGEQASFMATNVVASRTVEIKAPDVVIKVSPDRMDLVETKDIDGRKFLMIELTDNVEINGIVAKP